METLLQGLRTCTAIPSWNRQHWNNWPNGLIQQKAAYTFYICIHTFPIPNKKARTREQNPKCMVYSNLCGSFNRGTFVQVI